MYHYKDENPLETIRKIRRVLSDIDIFVQESWQVVLGKFYSVRLQIAGTPFGTNGKGITPELALASAYGEIIERLSNQFLYSIFRYYQFDEQLSKFKGFYFFPDETYMDIPEVIDNIPLGILKIFTPTDVKNSEGLESYFKHIIKVTPKSCNSDFIMVPYYNVFSKSILYLPSTLISIFYLSNGLCAGNSPEEALVQGISEIFERYVNRVTINNEIKHPTIPKDTLQRYFKSQNEMIEQIEKKGNYKINVLDCSFKTGLPVLALVIIANETGGYFVKFGSHPDRRIALERTLTELFQGRKLFDYKNLILFEYNVDKKYTDQENVIQIFLDGKGQYPISIFQNALIPDSASKKYSHHFPNNKECLLYLLKIIKGKGWELLIRDNSFLGFPSFRVIIPGIAEARYLTKKDYIKIGKNYDVINISKNIPNSSNKDLSILISYVKGEISQGKNSNIATLTNLPYLDGFSYLKIGYNFFLACAYYKKGNYKNAFNQLKEYIDNKSGKVNIYYKCARDFLGLLAAGKPKGDAMHWLQNVYTPKIVDAVFNDLSEPAGVFKYYPKLECPNCSRCKERENCSYERIKGIHKKIKERMIEYYSPKSEFNLKVFFHNMNL